MLKNRICLLCSCKADKVKDDVYYSCLKCKAIFLDQKLLLSPEKEKRRYKEHNNNVNDKGYRRFVAPITSAVFKEQDPDSTGLDFGAGPGPVISTVLKEQGYNIFQYDPYFFYDKKLLEKKYDYIVCCEVVEHFKDPKK